MSVRLRTHHLIWVAAIAKCLAVNAGAIFLCSILLDGFAIHGFSSYALAAAGIELPSRAFLVVVRVWGRLFESMIDAPYAVRLLTLGWWYVLVLVLPLVVSSCLPGLVLAEWLSPNLRIDGAWTYVVASVITMFVLMPFRQLKAFIWAYWFVRGTSEDADSHGVEQPEATS